MSFALACKWMNTANRAQTYFSQEEFLSDLAAFLTLVCIKLLVFCQQRKVTNILPKKKPYTFGILTDLTEMTS